MYRGLSAAILAAGIILIVWGMNASESFSSDVSRIFTGSPTNKTVWLFACGIAASVVGLSGLILGKNKE